MSKKKLPKTVYAKWNDESATSPDEEWFDANPVAEKLIDHGETLRVGVYELVGYATVSNATTVTREEIAQRRAK